MKEKFKFNDVIVKDPNSYKPQGATTSTDDSDRTQDLKMHNTPIGTILSYSFEWEDIEVEEAAKILSQIANRSKYSLYHMDANSGTWKTYDFYTSNYSYGTLKYVNGRYLWESLSFNAVRINPV